MNICFLNICFRRPLLKRPEKAAYSYYEEDVNGKMLKAIPEGYYDKVVERFVFVSPRGAGIKERRRCRQAF
jgi:hypothetical protein